MEKVLSIYRQKVNNSRSEERACNFLIACFFLLYLILPEYFALEISESFPLLTASRLLIIVAFLFVITRYGRNFQIVKLPVAFKIYFIALIFVNVIHLSDAFSDSLKELFSLIFEQLLLVYILFNLLNTKDRIFLAVKWMVYASAIITLFGAIEAFTGVNVFFYLTTTQREMLQSEYVRLGFQRAAGPFGHSVYFGTYCVLMLPFSLFLSRQTKKFRFTLIAILNVVGVFLSMARGAIVVMVALLIILLLKHGIRLTKRGFKIVTVVCIVLAFSLLIITPVRELLVELINSTMESIFSEGATNQDFGNNTAGLASRLGQFSGFLWTIQQNCFLFGFGSNCHVRGLVRYYSGTRWNTIRSFDVGYVAQFMQYGIIGFIGYLSLFIYLIKSSGRGSKGYMKNLRCPIVLFYITYLLSLFTVAGSTGIFWIITSIFLAYQHIEKSSIIITD